MNLANLKKADIVKRSNYKCKHGHNGLAHPSCYEKETGDKEKLAFLDIESAAWGFNANVGMVLSWYIVDDEGNYVYDYTSHKEILKGKGDKRMLKRLGEILKDYDRVITFYGKRFDVPFLRTRCVYHKIYFPVYQEVAHTDVYDIVRTKFKFSRRSLDMVCRFFGIDAKGHRLDHDLWLRAIAGDKKAMNWILEHNKEDVDSLRTLWHRINDYARITSTSI